MIFKLNKKLYEIKRWGKEIEEEKIRKIAFILSVANTTFDIASDNVEGDGYGYLDLEEGNKLTMYKDILKKINYKEYEGIEFVLLENNEVKICDL